MTTHLPSLHGALRYAAFTTSPSGGNPAGVVLNGSTLDADEMQAIATSIGYAETAFVIADHSPTGGARQIRYFSPLAEVPFCGHATIALAIALAERLGVQTFHFTTSVGEITIDTTVGPRGELSAAFTSVEPQVRDFEPGVLEHLLRFLGLTTSDLHFRYPTKEAFAGNWHPVLVLAHQDNFDRFSFDPDTLQAFMQQHGWPGTVSVLVEQDMAENSIPQFEARNLFPVGTITEDPATGSAAAAFGGYLRALNQVEPPTRILIHQGRHVDRLSLLTVDIPATGGIIVSGTAVKIDQE